MGELVLQKRNRIAAIHLDHTQMGQWAGTLKIDRGQGVVGAGVCHGLNYHRGLISFESPGLAQYMGQMAAHHRAFVVAVPGHRGGMGHARLALGPQRGGSDH